MSTYEILREGEKSGDGRLLAEGSVRVKDDSPIPVQARAEDGGYDSMIVGRAWNMTRVQNRIYVETDVVLPEGTCLTAGGTTPTNPREVDKDTLLFEDYVLRYVMISDADKYPWKDNEEGGGGADGG